MVLLVLGLVAVSFYAVTATYMPFIIHGQTVMMRLGCGLAYTAFVAEVGLVR